MTGRDITIKALRYDRSVKRTWEAGIVSKNNGHLVAIGRFSMDVRHEDLGEIAMGTVSIEHFWLDRWSNVFCFYEPDGRFRNYYCNIALPPHIGDANVEFVDLDLDVVMWPGRDAVLLDEKDLEISRIRYSIPDDTIAKAYDEAGSLLAAMNRADPPFDLHLKMPFHASIRSV